MQAAVDRTSSESRIPVTRAAPLLMPFKISDRCEMDLSPGTVIVARMRFGLFTITVAPDTELAAEFLVVD